MITRTFTTIVALLVLAACGGIVEPSTELVVENRTGSTLDVRVWSLPAPSATAVPVFHDPTFTATLADGATRAWEVEPGWYHVRGETADALAGTATVKVADGTRHVVPFYDPHAT